MLKASPAGTRWSECAVIYTVPPANCVELSFEADSETLSTRHLNDAQAGLALASLPLETFLLRCCHRSTGIGAGWGPGSTTTTNTTINTTTAAPGTAIAASAVVCCLHGCMLILGFARRSSVTRISIGISV
ncbi:hypothetical protein C0Q70_10058 [Pomacea canaliculata]|uniref:Uncharacterized protein n=1 Tax=Pomacea canaliculata TaxID=400727 RepID=A0A2T7PBI4_POMCA|nr:hypothetical protein C0Q70_10058 [Pomacea canaliculata]